ncbi:MAG TPA: plastocyanin/azurin family copper-binding protein [Solirubrobacteraceae bacterium]|nr:plastocyanin/azurin family copper-binding protein [Solirubrobacteraceae bacterium]
MKRPRARPTTILPCAALAAGALALAGCGGGSSTTTSATTSTSAPAAGASATGTTSAGTTTAPTHPSAIPKGALEIAANAAGELRYDKTALSASAGRVTVAFTNTSPLAHNFTVENSAKQVVGATPTFEGGTKLLKLDLKPGVYKFFCSVPGHRMAGMEGTLTVR